MPFRELTVLAERDAFVQEAAVPERNLSALCRQFGIGRRTAYRWLGRVAAGEGLADRSRRPLASPRRTSPEMEALIVGLREVHPAWGGRKISRRLSDLGWPAVPPASTVTEVLRRAGLLGRRAGQPRAFQRFEHEAPNDLWQMDFKGHVPCGSGRCHPLTVLDDHSRYNMVLQACSDERTETVQAALTLAFREYGLPRRIATDNGSPWGDGPGHPYTPLGVWLLRLGIAISHSRPYHPQTLGKEERFHRSLKAEVLNEPLLDLDTSQHRFDHWRQVYNYERPHEALGGAVPATRYAPSQRPYPERLPALEYAPGDLVRKVQDGGAVHVLGQVVRVPKAFRGHPIAFRPAEGDGQYAVLFADIPIGPVALAQRGVSHVPVHMAPISPV